jgi:hypothetical protein
MSRVQSNSAKLKLVRRDNEPEAAGAEKGQQIIPGVVSVIWVVAVY